MEWKDDRIEGAVRGQNPMVLGKMKSGFAVIGDTQFLPGYCVLLGYPKSNFLNELDEQHRKEFLFDMSLIGDAITDVCEPLKINYDILGNIDTYLHAHIFPRYAWEEETKRKNPVWKYPKEMWELHEYQFNEEKHGDMKKKLAERLKQLMRIYY
jgi:diadenosine tetraphosphate (Ap4A) HIT family hydrolase